MSIRCIKTVQLIHIKPCSTKNNLNNYFQKNNFNLYDLHWKNKFTYICIYKYILRYIYIYMFKGLYIYIYISFPFWLKKDKKYDIHFFNKQIYTPYVLSILEKMQPNKPLRRSPPLNQIAGGAALLFGERYQFVGFDFGSQWARAPWCLEMGIFFQ